MELQQITIIKQCAENKINKKHKNLKKKKKQNISLRRRRRYLLFETQVSGWVLCFGAELSSSTSASVSCQTSSHFCKSQFLHLTFYLLVFFFVRTEKFVACSLDRKVAHLLTYLRTHTLPRTPPFRGLDLLSPFSL